MGILFTTHMGFLLTITMGFLFTIVLGIQFTISKSFSICLFLCPFEIRSCPVNPAKLEYLCKIHTIIN